MPVPSSKRQFRFLQAVAHGNSTVKTSLTPDSAKKGLSEMYGSYGSLPEKAGKMSKAVKKIKSKKKSRPGY